MSAAIKEVIERAKQDPQFFHDLVFKPAEAVKGLRLSPEERAAIAANNPEVLVGLAVGRLMAACGCTSAGTCESTCTATCTVTFTSLREADRVVVEG